MSVSTYQPGAGLNSFVTKLPTTVAPLVPLFGTQNPEGAVEANPGTIFNDITNAAVYVKVSGTGVNGWRQLAYTVPVAGAGGSNTATSAVPVYGGTAAQRDATTPTASYAIWILTDSVPPLQISVWANGQWN